MEPIHHENGDLPFRWFAGWIGFLVGFVLGLFAVALAWRMNQPHGVLRGAGPMLGLDYYLLSAASSLAGGVAGLGLARLRDLPADDP